MMRKIDNNMGSLILKIKEEMKKLIRRFNKWNNERGERWINGNNLLKNRIVMKTGCYEEQDVISFFAK